MPTSTHEGYRMLSLDKRMVVAKLAAILRIADALENSASQRISSIDIDINGQTMYILVHGVDDLTVQDLSLQDRKELFQRVYGLDVELKTASMYPGETSPA
jgi:exopolyphosphatase/guanosine-5'-triphosphate,3'-diphosphate pyrophosphatase